MLELYTKTQGNRVKYEPYQPTVTDVELTDEQVLTLCSSLAMTVIMQYRQLLPEHKRNARKVKTVEAALFDMLHGSGHALDPQMVDYAISCWNLAMVHMSAGAKLQER